jgi:predicted Zn-dependent protease
MYLCFLRNALFVCFVLFAVNAAGQMTELITPSVVAAADAPRSLAELEQAYKREPGNMDIYANYLNALLAAKNYKEAESLIGIQQRYTNTPLIVIDLGRIYEAAGKGKKAEEQYERALTAINGDDVLTAQLSRAFTEAGRDDYTIKAYEAHRNLLHSTYLYSGPLARLYAKTGATDKAIDALLDGAPYQQGGVEEVKANMLELLGTDAKKLQIAQKALIKRINAQPENIFYSELLTWLYTQKDDWEGALIQMIAIDERNREAGNRLLQFAQTALKQNQYEIALKSLDAIIEKGEATPLYPSAMLAKLNVQLQQLEDAPVYNKADAARLAISYDALFVKYPQLTTTDVAGDYARLEAQYNDNPKKAISFLKAAIAQPGASRAFAGRSKLQLGDYQILTGQVWEASLTYSQVDKDFREDMLGEEARFRNAKLAYYRGDFEWAQGQLSVLKASTSELIANDALSLSVLITENMPDSNNKPMLAFARADLLLFQNKTDEAVRLLDSVATAYPKHTLNDDLLMSRSAIAMKRRDYAAALSYLNRVVKEYGKDVLADDALFKTADIYERYLKQPTEAQKYFEQLIIDYPGSTYVQIARQRLQKLSSPVLGT